MSGQHFSALNNDSFTTEVSHSKTLAFGLAACAVVLCIVGVNSNVQSNAQQMWAPGATMTTRGPVVASRAPIRQPMATEYVRSPYMAVPADMQETTMEYDIPTYPSSAPQTNSIHVTALVGGAFFMMGAAAAALRNVFFPQQESMALLPMTGVADDEMLSFDNLAPMKGSVSSKTRKGRGHGAGQGGTCGFGNRGQKARSGHSVRPGFEGGQNPLYRRTPKYRGRPLGPGHVRKIYEMVSMAALNEAGEGSTVSFMDEGRGFKNQYKVGGVKPGEDASIPANLTVRAHAFSKTARSAIEAAGGKCVILDKYNREGENKVWTREGAAAADEGSAAEVAMFAVAGERSVKVGTYKEPTPLSKNLPASKPDVVAQVHAELMRSTLVFGFSVDGFTVSQLTKLRNEMPAGTKIQVVKNTLFRLASRGTGFESIDPITTGSKAWCFVPVEDMQETVKTYLKYIKDTKKPNKILGGAMEGQFMDSDAVEQVTTLPTKEELLTKIAVLIKQVTTKVAYGVNATPRKLAIGVRMACVDDKEGHEEALEAARAAITKELGEVVVDEE